MFGREGKQTCSCTACVCSCMHAIDIFCRSDLNGTNLTGKGLIDDVKGVRSEGSSNYLHGPFEYQRRAKQKTGVGIQ